MVLCYDVPHVAQICNCAVCVVLVAWVIHVGWLTKGVVIAAPSLGVASMGVPCGKALASHVA